jgi:sulfhydrogenase subunit beta (sulfur reductase)
MGKFLKKEDFNKFLLHLASKGELWAPVQKDILRFEKVENVKDIVLEGNPWFSTKKLLFPKTEAVFRYDDDDIEYDSDKSKDTVIFGLRLCDLNAVKIMDALFNDEFVLPSYKRRREKTLLIGLHCHQPQNDYCFCESMELTKFYDLFLVELTNGYYIDIGSEKGKKVVSHLKDHEYEVPKIRTNKILNHKDYAEVYKQEGWDDLGKKCLDCGQCTTICPTCTCFDVIDHMELDLKNGTRDVVWDGCQFKDFTKVAGGHIFRESRTARLKHRVFHKLDFFKRKFNMYMCTGCGRCIRVCPTKIDFVEYINRDDT